LQKFVDQQGYTIIGGHEEEYIIGPEIKENPEEYITILRYRVQKPDKK
jgi:effector-binding domain-containing protein